MTGDQGVAEYIVQEATIESLKVASSNPQRVLNVGRRCGWMCGIVRHVALRWMDKEKWREGLLGENALLSEGESVPAGRPGLGRGAAD